MAERITGPFVKPFRYFHYTFGELFEFTVRSPNRTVIGILFEIVSESILLKKGPVVFFVVGHSVSLLHKPVNQEPPVVVILTEIDRSVHGLHPPGRKPLLPRIK